jgi:hypothetical protein
MPPATLTPANHEREVLVTAKAATSKGTATLTADQVDVDLAASLADLEQRFAAGDPTVSADTLTDLAGDAYKTKLKAEAEQRATDRKQVEADEQRRTRSAAEVHEALAPYRTAEFAECCKAAYTALRDLVDFVDRRNLAITSGSTRLTGWPRADSPEHPGHTVGAGAAPSWLRIDNTTYEVTLPGEVLLGLTAIVAKSFNGLSADRCGTVDRLLGGSLALTTEDTIGALLATPPQ